MVEALQKLLRKKPQNLRRLAIDGPKPRTGHILGYVAGNASTPRPHATHHLFCLPALIIAQKNAQTIVPVPTRLQQAASSSPNRWVPKSVKGVHQGEKKTFFKNDLDHVESKTSSFGTF